MQPPTGTATVTAAALTIANVRIPPARICARHLRGHSQGDGYRQCNCLYKYDSCWRNDRASDESSARTAQLTVQARSIGVNKIFLTCHDPEWRYEHHDDHPAEPNTPSLHRRRFDR